ncbi:MAG: hypothetical protein JWQ49_4874 [Edaphobacter sp.]|nr:hypothetical protein [Edaphobacter sp.]
MDEPQSQNPASQGADPNSPIVEPSTPFQANHKDTPKDASTGENEANNVVNAPKKTRWNEIRNAGVDRQIELVLAFAITFFSAAQWLTSCNNNRSTSNQVDKIIKSADLIGIAAGTGRRSWRTVYPLPPSTSGFRRSASWPGRWPTTRCSTRRRRRRSNGFREWKGEERG